MISLNDPLVRKIQLECQVVRSDHRPPARSQIGKKIGDIHRTLVDGEVPFVGSSQD